MVWAERRVERQFLWLLLTRAFCVWLYTVRTRAIDLRTTLIFASLEAAPPVTFETRNCASSFLRSSRRFRRASLFSSRSSWALSFPARWRQTETFRDTKIDQLCYGGNQPSVKLIPCKLIHRLGHPQTNNTSRRSASHCTNTTGRQSTRGSK